MSALPCDCPSHVEMQALLHGNSAMSPPAAALVSLACLLMCFSTLLLARLVVAELEMRLDRLERGTTGLLAPIELLKPNGKETQLLPLPASTPKAHTWAVLRKPLGLALLEVDAPQKMHHQVA